MGARMEPIPFSSRPDGKAELRESGARLGRALGNIVASWRRQTNRASSTVSNYWDELQEPRKRERHVWKLVAVAAAAGVIVGALLPVRRS